MNEKRDLFLETAMSVGLQNYLDQIGVNYELNVKDKTLRFATKGDFDVEIKYTDLIYQHKKLEYKEPTN